MSIAAVAAWVFGYVLVVVGCWVKVAADYRYNTLRGRYSGCVSPAVFSNQARVERAFNQAVLSTVWPLWLAGRTVLAAASAFVNAAGCLGERRAQREDAAAAGGRRAEQ